MTSIYSNCEKCGKPTKHELRDQNNLKEAAKTGSRFILMCLTCGALKERHKLGEEL